LENFGIIIALLGLFAQELYVGELQFDITTSMNLFNSSNSFQQAFISDNEGRQLLVSKFVKQ
jgi:hypothetical protein